MTSSYNRRHFLRQSAGTAASITAASLWTPPKPLLAQIGVAHEPLPSIEDPRIKSLVQRGLDASSAAGAAYADVRLTHRYTRGIKRKSVNDQESMEVGVRALVDGYWGFASGPVWSVDEMARLGQEATHQAKTNALGKPRPTTLAPTPVVQDGQWITPIRIDPFSLHPSEICDILEGIGLYVSRRRDKVFLVEWKVRMDRVEKAFGSSEGSYYTQRQYITNGELRLNYTTPDDRVHVARFLDGLSPVSMGFELFDEPRLRQDVDALIEDIKADLALPTRPVDVGRYDVVFGAGAVAGVLDGTIGLATELDRALGYEANNSGTSYLDEPFDMVGTLRLGSPLLTVTMNRNEPGGAATVQWDDEGVPTRSVTLVNQGILTDFQTTRESATWLREQSPRQSQELSHHPRGAAQSTGSSYAPSAMDAPLARAGNLVLQPSSANQTVDDLIMDMDNGIFFREVGVGLDFRQQSGFAGGGRAYEIRHGKKVSLLSGAGILFKATEFWKKLSALGGASSARRGASSSAKGQPSQWSVRSVTAVPATFTQISVIDVTRKA